MSIDFNVPKKYPKYRCCPKYRRKQKLLNITYVLNLMAKYLNFYIGFCKFCSVIYCPNFLTEILLSFLRSFIVKKRPFYVPINIRFKGSNPYIILVNVTRVNLYRLLFSICFCCMGLFI